MIYLNNAATSYPKPLSVQDAMLDALQSSGGNPGRSVDSLTGKADDVVNHTRFLAAKMFGISNPNHVIFTSSATEALNIAILGTLKSGDHVITSTMEHNSVTRPLYHLETQEGVRVTKIPMDPIKGVDPDDIVAAITDDTKLVCLTHISNVTGTMNDIAEIGDICHKKNVRFLVDASQSAGTHPIHMDSMNIDLLAMPGHKGLMGPSGTGLLCIGDHVDPALLNPIKFGGTGVQSELPYQPIDLPFRYESGTLNVPGIAGLGAGIRFINETGMDNIFVHESFLMQMLLDWLSDIPSITIYGNLDATQKGAVLSINIDGMDPVDVAMILDTSFEIAVRPGLHCAPDAHRTIGTIDIGGTIRISPGYFTTAEEIHAFIDAMKEISE
ncbi:MAG: aminotransferase class V-fold PLP-dependent enzyme [Clostridiales Family XIII bacterium]|jgi:cysteine desulfurase family protein|nr:aminotransferase class V-fold PLP-dependent enzyme [Clostridiales Family XIII bacterium]